MRGLGEFDPGVPLGFSTRVVRGFGYLEGAVVEKSIEVTSQIGLQGRGSARLAHAANQFQSDVLLVNEVCSVNAKDVMQVMRFSARAGTWVRVQATGPDEAAAVKLLVALLTA